MSEPFIEHVIMIKFFQQFKEIKAVMSLAKDGSMKDDENLRKFFEKNDIDKNSVARINQVHGRDVKIVTNNNLNEEADVDALVTKEKGIFLSVGTADCVPVFFYESEKKIIGIAHAGWRGTVKGVIGNIFNKIIELGGKAENIHVALAPAINACHFEVKEDVAEKFEDYKEFIIRNDKIYIDLKGIIKKQLSELGVSEKNIENNNDCTHCNKKYFSYRRDKPPVVETMISLIKIN